MLALLVAAASSSTQRETLRSVVGRVQATMQTMMRECTTSGLGDRWGTGRLLQGLTLFLLIVRWLRRTRL